MDYPSFIGSLGALFGADQNRGKVILEWVRANVPEELLQPLYNRILENEQFFPMPVVLKKHLEQLTGNTAERAYAEAMKAMHKAGSYNSVEFENTRIAETIRLGWGNWHGFGNDVQGENWMRKRFIEIYNTLSGRFDGRLSRLIEQQGGYFDLVTIGGGGVQQIERQHVKKLEAKQ